MEKMTFVVRKAVEEDIPQIKEVAKEAFWQYAENAEITTFVKPLEETDEDLRRDLNNKMVLVALQNERIIGSVRVEVFSDKNAYLSRFGVREEYQNNGVGKVLMNAVDTAMKRMEVKNLYLHTASRMFSLVRFYYGRGFYIESTTNDRGYIRALLCKEYETENVKYSLEQGYEDNQAVV